jgi:autotransporter-associated beta strand protein
MMPLVRTPFASVVAQASGPDRQPEPRVILSTLHSFCRFSVVLAALSWLVASTAVADDRYWSGQSGSSDNIDQDANWWGTGTTHPNSGDNLYFNNTAGSRHWPYCNYGSGAYFAYLISYSGANGIHWRGDKTYCYKFENSSDGSLLEAEAMLSNRTGLDTDLEINPVGSGGVQVTNVDLQNGRQLNVLGGNTLTVNGVISQSGTGNTSLAVLGSGAKVVLNGAATYGGVTAIQDGSIQIASGNDRLPVGTTVTLGP